MKTLRQLVNDITLSNLTRNEYCDRAAIDPPMLVYIGGGIAGRGGSERSTSRVSRTQNGTVQFCSADDPVYLLDTCAPTRHPHIITIGRSPNSDIVINNPRVSRTHAIFRRDVDGLVLKDAGSSNGTTINYGVGHRNCRRGEPNPLVSGTEIQLGGNGGSTLLYLSEPCDKYDYLTSLAVGGLRR